MKLTRILFICIESVTIVRSILFGEPDSNVRSVRTTISVKVQFTSNTDCYDKNLAL